jgi:signal transduction histidine kinase
MTLVNRVSAFFLIAMAATLTAFAVVLYVLIDQTLATEFDSHLDNVLHILSAAVEVEDDDVKWEPNDHTIRTGADEGEDAVRWGIYGDGSLIDKSKNATAADITDLNKLAATEDESPEETGDWIAKEMELEAPDPKPPSEREPSKEFSKIRVVVARSNSELFHTLHRVGLVLLALTAGTITLIAVIGRWYCMKALKPVQTMAAIARSVTHADFSVRLPLPEHRDELADLSAAFNSLLEQLQVAFERQQRFTGDAAHQLRTPLTVLKGQIDVALRRPRSSEDYAGTMQLLRGQAVEMQQIVEGLLYLARSEGDTNLPAFEEDDIARWLTNRAARWRENERGGDLIVNVPEGLRLATSWELMGQLLDNLVSNAFKYSSPGAPVTVSVSHRDNSVVFDVEDRGIGMSAEDLTAIYEPFFRSAAARQSGVSGTGLGLPIAHRISQALGGRLECTSTLGEGSRFRFVIPATIRPATHATGGRVSLETPAAVGV